MSDFSNKNNYVDPPPFISTNSRYSSLWETRGILNSTLAPSSLSWATANQARYIPMSLPWAYPVRRVWWVNGSSVTGNSCFAIYNREGKRLYTTGSTAQSGASAPQFVTPTAFWLPPGDYYFGFNNDGTTNRVWGTALAAEHQRWGGIQQEAVGAVALPATATFAVASVAGWAFCGITWTASGF